jgi:RNA polymerase sigma-70 factor (ECF subfamily)
VSRVLDPIAIGVHRDRLLRTARALAGEEAEDLVQESALRVLARPRTIGSEADALPYLLAVLRNTFVSMVRARDRRPRTLPLDAAEGWASAPAGRTPPAVLEAREILDAVAALPDGQRRVLAAVDVAGLTYTEAAAVLGIPAGTIMSRLSRGRDRVAAAVGV